MQRESFDEVTELVRNDVDDRIGCTYVSFYVWVSFKLKFVDVSPFNSFEC